MTHDELLTMAAENVADWFDKDGADPQDLPEGEYAELVKEEFRRLRDLEIRRYGP